MLIFLCSRLAFIIAVLPSHAWGSTDNDTNSSVSDSNNIKTMARECGKIDVLTNNKKIQLWDGIPMTPQEFEYVHLRTLKEARVTPKRSCAINVCGHAFWGDGQSLECTLFQWSEKLNIVFYNYTTSAMFCGCQRSDDECFNPKTCSTVASELIWTDKDCAIMYQEKDCNSCNFESVRLSDGQRFMKNYTHQFTSLIVREHCRVELYIEAFKRLKYLPIGVTPLPIIYAADATPSYWNNVTSAFQIDPEIFECRCGGVPSPVANILSSSSSSMIKETTTSAVKVTELIDSGNERENLAPAVAGGIAAATLLCFLVVGLLVHFWFKRSKASQPSQSNNIIANEEPDEFDVLLREFNEECHQSYLVARSTFKIPVENLLEPLGHGRFGIVYKGVVRHDNDGLIEEVAVKKVDIKGSPDFAKRSFFREVRTFQRIGIKCENIVKFVGACWDKDGLFLLTELCEGGSLENHLRTHLRPQILDKALALPHVEMIQGDRSYFFVDRKAEALCLQQRNEPKLKRDQLQQIISWCAQIATGMECLYVNGIIHVDLAARNLLLKNGIIKICDFGLSREFIAHSIIAGDFPMNSFAPEFRTDPNTRLTAYVDIWAYGSTLWEIFTLGDALYAEGNSYSEVCRLLDEGYRHPKPQLAPPGVYEYVILRCWDEVPENRPNFTHLRMFFENFSLVEGFAEESEEDGNIQQGSGSDLSHDYPYNA